MAILNDGDIFSAYNTFDRKTAHSLKINAFASYILDRCDATTGWAVVTGTGSLATTTLTTVNGGTALNINMTAGSTNATKTFASAENLAKFVGVSTGLARGGYAYIWQSKQGGAWTNLTITFTDSSARTYVVRAETLKNSGNTSSEIGELYLPVTTEGFSKIKFNLPRPSAVSSSAFDWTVVVSMRFDWVGTGSGDDARIDMITIEPTIVRTPVELDNCNATTGWAISPAGTVSTNTGVDGGTAVNAITTAVTTTQTLSKTLSTPVDISSYCGATSGRPTYDDVYFTCYIYADSINTTTALRIRIGSDSSNYFEKNIDLNTTDDIYTGTQTNLQTKFMLAEIDLRFCTMVGTPVLTAIDYIEYFYSHNSATENMRIDDVNFSYPTLRTAHVQEGDLYVINKRFHITDQWLPLDTSWNESYIVAQVNEISNTATLTRKAYTDALIYTDIPVGFFYRDRVIQVGSWPEENYGPRAIFNTNNQSGGASSLYIDIPIREYKLHKYLMLFAYTQAVSLDLFVNGGSAINLFAGNNNVLSNPTMIYRYLDLRDFDKSQFMTLKLEAGGNISSVLVIGE